MIDLAHEDVFTLPKATKFVPNLNGRKPHASTLWRWCRKGIQGVSLEYVKIGGTMCTSREALSRFYSAVADAENPQQPTSPGTPIVLSLTYAQRKAQSERSERDLIEGGM